MNLKDYVIISVFAILIGTVINYGLLETDDSDTTGSRGYGGGGSYSTGFGGSGGHK